MQSLEAANSGHLGVMSQSMFNHTPCFKGDNTVLKLLTACLLRPCPLLAHQSSVKQLPTAAPAV
jgi:hypothetical protein